MTSADCPAIVKEDDADIELTTYEVTNGTNVQIGCKRFTFRVVGPKSATCLNGTWSDTGVDNIKCEWTGEYSMEEKIVLGVAISAAALFVLILMIIAVYLIVYGKRRDDEEKRRNLDDPSPPPSLVNRNINKYSRDYNDFNGPAPYGDGDLRAQAERPYRDDDPPYRTYERESHRTDEGYTVYQGNKYSYTNKAYNPRYDDTPQDGFLDSRNQQVTSNEFMRYDWGGKIPRPRLEEYPPVRRY